MTSVAEERSIQVYKRSPLELFRKKFELLLSQLDNILPHSLSNKAREDKRGKKE